MSMGSIYSATDKALFDAINQASVTSSDLRALFLKHGIIISKTTPRAVLARHYARLLHDYYDFEALARMFGKSHRRERSTSVEVEAGGSLSEFEEAAHEVVTKLVENSDVANVAVMGDGSLQIHVRYKTFNFTKSEFRQVEVRTAVITVEEENGSIVLRGPDNEKVTQICSDLISILEAKDDGELKVGSINLEDFQNSEDRTRFFELLIDKVPGYSQLDVSDVYLYNPKKDVDGLDDEEGEIDDDEPTLGIHITRASLKGGRVLESPEIKELLVKGFYISKIVWKARESGFDADKVEFEAQFGEPETCTRFSYLVKGYYEYQGDGRFSKHRKQFDSADERELGKLIERAARAAIASLPKIVEATDDASKMD